MTRKKYQKRTYNKKVVYIYKIHKKACISSEFVLNIEKR